MRRHLLRSVGSSTEVQGGCGRFSRALDSAPEVLSDWRAFPAGEMGRARRPRCGLVVLTVRLRVHQQVLRSRRWRIVPFHAPLTVSSRVPRVAAHTARAVAHDSDIPDGLSTRNLLIPSVSRLLVLSEGGSSLFV